MATSSPSNARTGPELPARFERWPFWRRWLGRRSERAAARFLKRLGYRILAANISDALGELDLLAVTPDQQTLVVVEVRSTSEADPQKAADSVNPTKQKRISEATVRYLQRHHLLGRVTVRFDVLALAWPELSGEPKILHLPDAFPATGQFQFFS